MGNDEGGTLPLVIKGEWEVTGGDILLLRCEHEVSRQPLDANEAGIIGNK